MKQSSQVMRAVVLALMMVLTGGLLTHTRAQGQICRDVSNITICGDTLVTEVGTQFHLRGNIKIGPKGGPAVVHVTDMNDTVEGIPLDPQTYQAQFVHSDTPQSASGHTDVLFGEIKFINDPTGLALLGTKVILDPSNENSVVSGRLFVDPVAQRIFAPAAGAVPVHTERGVKRNEALELSFITQAGALTFYKDGGTVEQLGLIDAEFLLNTKLFKATLPVDLKLNDAAENPNLRLTMKFQWTENRNFSGTIDAFKYAFAGLLLDVAGVVVKLPQEPEPATFEAATVKVLRSDNPGFPNLDPKDPTTLFTLSKLKYKNGAWELGGVAVGISDWEIGPAFRMINQTIGIINDPVTNAQAFEIKSTMQFGAAADASKLPITLKIGRQQVNNQFKPVFSAGLQNIKPKLGTLTFNLSGAAFVGDAAQNFFGIQATSAALQWPAHLGGKTAAAINNFKLGTDKDRNFIFQIGNGTIGLPQIENNLFVGNLAATLDTLDNSFVITSTGTLTIKLPGNANSGGVNAQAIMRYGDPGIEAAAAAVAAAESYEAQPVANTRITRCIGVLGSTTTCPGTTPPPPPPGPVPFEFRLTGFSMKLAGFGITVANPKGTTDGGFTADSVALTLPIGMISSLSSGSGIQVQGFGISGSGNVSIQGGGFELAPITVGSVQFVGLKGTFIKKSDGTYEFTAAGKLPLPGIEPGTNTGGIGVNITVKLANTGNFGGLGVIVEFGSPPLPPIPIGSTGMNLTRVSGSFDVTNQTLTIGLGLTAESKFRIPLGSLGSLPLAKANGNVTTQFSPFKFTGNVSLSVLIFQVATATVNIGDGQGFDGGDGMNVVANVNAVLVTGEFKMRIGKGVPTDPEKRRFAANAKWVFGILANQYGIGRPPFNLGGIQVNLGGGVFVDNNTSPAGEAVGVRGSACGPNGNLCIGFFVNLGEDIGGSDFLDFTNIDKYVLIPAAVVRAAAAAGQPGYSSQALLPQAAQEMGLLLSASQINGTEAVLQETINIPVTSTTTLLAGINYAGGSPTISLKLPNNTVLTEESVNGTTQTFLRETETVSDTTNLLFTISGATPGTYQLIINNAPAEYELVSYTLNSSPSAAIDSVTCGGGNIAGLTVTCDDPIGIVVAASADTPDATNVTVEWTANDSDSPNAEVSVGYVTDPGPAIVAEFSNINFVAEGLPVGAGSQVIDFSEVGTGTYRAVVVVDDKQNGLIIVNSATTITVDDQLPPAIPGGLAAVSQAGELLIKWDQNSEGDLAGYDIGFALVNDTSQFIYTRTMGPKEIVTGTNSIVDAKLWGLNDDTEVFYGLRAYDTSGNYSNWTPLQSAKPWALSPNTWNPVPNGAGEGPLEIAFDVPMVPESLEDALTVRDAAGNVLAGSYYFLVNAEGNKIIGLGFAPFAPVSGNATATLLGGPDGAQAEDGRTMGGNFTWSFSWQFSPEGILMPLLYK